MKNKANILNLILSVIVLILLFQLNRKSKTETEMTTQKQEEKKSPAIRQKQNKGTEKVSVGPKAYIMPKPALVVGSYDENGKPNIMTAAWAGICNSSPLSLAVSIRPSRKTYENIMASKSFTVNVPSVQYVAEMDYVGQISGHNEDKFTKLGLTPIKSELVNAPYIKEFPVAIECELIKTVDLGSHTQFIGKIKDTKLDANCVKENGKIDVNAINPVFYESDFYYSYGVPVAKPWDAYKVFLEDKTPDFMPKNPINAAIANIHERKSVRQYTSEKPSPFQLETLLRAGMAAPTAKNSQPWEFVLINDQEILTQLANALPYAKMLTQVSAAIVVCGNLNLSLGEAEDNYWVQDCSAATQNILLAAESIGLGAVWTGVHPRKEREEAVRKTLNMPAHLVPFNVIPVGYPVGKEKAKDKWKPERIHNNKW